MQRRDLLLSTFGPCLATLPSWASEPSSELATRLLKLELAIRLALCWGNARRNAISATRGGKRLGR
ncbi:MAG: hypothetical protein RLZZ454_1710 [Pseudomonadota bacterium]